jgi:hypothetical protein
LELAYQFAKEVPKILSFMDVNGGAG